MKLPIDRDYQRTLGLFIIPRGKVFSIREKAKKVPINTADGRDNSAGQGRVIRGATRKLHVQATVSEPFIWTIDM